MAISIFIYSSSIFAKKDIDTTLSWAIITAAYSHNQVSDNNQKGPGFLGEVFVSPYFGPRSGTEFNQPITILWSLLRFLYIGGHYNTVRFTSQASFKTEAIMGGLRFSKLFGLTFGAGRFDANLNAKQLIFKEGHSDEVPEGSRSLMIGGAELNIPLTNYFLISLLYRRYFHSDHHFKMNVLAIGTTLMF